MVGDSRWPTGAGRVGQPAAELLNSVLSRAVRRDGNGIVRKFCVCFGVSCLANGGGRQRPRQPGHRLDGTSGTTLACGDDSGTDNTSAAGRRSRRCRVDLHRAMVPQASREKIEPERLVPERGSGNTGRGQRWPRSAESAEIVPRQAAGETEIVSFPKNMLVARDSRCGSGGNDDGDSGLGGSVLYFQDHARYVGRRLTPMAGTAVGS